MWFSKTSFEICISATVFYSTFLAWECGADDISGGEIWNDDFVRIYRTAVPVDPIEFHNPDGNSSAVTATIAILSVLASAVFIVCLCYCLCWKLLPRDNNHNNHRRQSHAALVPPATVRSDNSPDNGGFGRSTSRVGNVSSRGVVNLAFSSHARDRVSEDGPPAYTTVVMETSPNAKSTNSLYPPVGETKQVETPPPAYCTVAPKF